MKKDRHIKWALASAVFLTAAALTSGAAVAADGTEVMWWIEAGAKTFAFGGAIAAFVYGALVYRLGDVFAKKKDVEQSTASIYGKLAEIDADVGRNGTAIASLEKRLAAMPDHEDIRELFKRLAAVESQVAVAATGISGLGTAVGRIEKFIEMLVENEIKGEKK